MWTCAGSYPSHRFRRVDTRRDETAGVNLRSDNPRPHHRGKADDLLVVGKKISTVLGRVRFQRQDNALVREYGHHAVEELRSNLEGHSHRRLASEPVARRAEDNEPSTHCRREPRTPCEALSECGPARTVEQLKVGAPEEQRLQARHNEPGIAPLRCDADSRGNPGKRTIPSKRRGRHLDPLNAESHETRGEVDAKRSFPGQHGHGCPHTRTPTSLGAQLRDGFERSRGIEQVGTRATDDLATEASPHVIAQDRSAVAKLDIEEISDVLGGHRLRGRVEHRDPRSSRPFHKRPHGLHVEELEPRLTVD